MQKIYYLFDPLCGRCYAVSNGLAELAENAEIELIPTGLFSYDRLIDADWAENAWTNDQRIHQLTGLSFSETYRQNILLGAKNFNSFALVQALTAVRQVEPTQELNVLRLFQKARYENGLDTADINVLSQILTENGFTQAVNILQNSATIDLAKERITQGAALAAELGVRGVPQIFKQTEQGLIQLNTQTFIK
ncbi:DsbA family protein [Actinobacillus equuli]|uniref:DsbA family protein n=1 Tax=Actinobacillus equuli TaxID=718 RepID=UPI002441C1DE|nr:DsbA family protein [Actinobacillus equuli]WGE75756.1 DsbA family protein [Actinobacillus equuli subsp. haemolyticus]WGE76505.1 DsbA family protein [Actinobacillus equuli subsp. haemolyticus]